MSATVHPFPARMAPELALQTLGELPKGSVILDPMMGSGTVVRQATDLGFRAIGFDLDPLAVLMTRVWTQPVRDDVIAFVYDKVLRIALAVDPDEITLPWIDEDAATAEFVEYWFGRPQAKELRCCAYALANLPYDTAEEAAALDVIRIALSRIIITKEQSASLARDTSHSRPHRVASSSSYSVFVGFERSIKIVRKRLLEAVPKGGADVRQGDARQLKLDDKSVSGVLTSPPYLNAIDYMRGHRMALVWLGHSLKSLRNIRASSVGAERAPDVKIARPDLRQAFGDITGLSSRHTAMIERYAIDIVSVMGELRRVLVPGGRATFVVGNSCLKGVFVCNADAVAKAAENIGLVLLRRYERDLPSDSRYLPTGAGSALHKRMRTESILTFAA